MKDKIKGLWKVLFGRTTIFISIILMQLLILIVGVTVLNSYVIVVNNILGILSVIIIVYIVNRRQNSSFKLMWVILIIATPIVGVSFYVISRIQPGTKKVRESLEREFDRQHEFLTPDKETLNNLIEGSGSEYGLFKYIYEEGGFPVHENCGVEYFPLGEDKFDELIKQLQSARKFIFIEYFIINGGEMWDQVLKVLKKKALEGVEVRLMYDGTNTMVNLPREYPEKMKRYGIDCKVFFPMKPFLTTHQNNRDHRKIAVIDGHTAFTGGVNLADEYINRIEKFGHWKDTAIMIKGSAVNNFTLMFLQMWNIYSEDREDYDQYLYDGSQDYGNYRVHQGGFIAPFGDSPFDEESVGKKVYLDILNRAQNYVHIMTPYLILDEEVINTLIFAAQRGIDVKVVLPHIPDKKYAYLLARTHYRDLISAGVKLYEYTPGFVHAKVFVSDDIKGVVGSINMDFRSLYLHFECAAYIFNNSVIDDIKDDFEDTLGKCQRITLKDCKEYPVIYKIFGSALRFVAPLM